VLVRVCLSLSPSVRLPSDEIVVTSNSLRKKKIFLFFTVLVAFIKAFCKQIISKRTAKTKYSILFFMVTKCSLKPSPFNDILRDYRTETISVSAARKTRGHERIGIGKARY